MTDAALGALYKALQARLNGASSVWGSRVYADLAPATASLPYLVYMWQGGGDRNRLKDKQDAELVVLVKCIANSLPVAMAALPTMTALLDEMGAQDRVRRGGGELVALDWTFCTTTKGTAIHVLELVDGNPIYHEGFQLRVVMEEKS